MRTWAAGIAAALLAAVASSAAARDIYVDNVGGDDRHTGYTAVSLERGQGPCRTIARALRIADTGDRVVLTKTDVPYQESITLQGGRNSGSEFRSFVLDGRGAILDLTQPAPDDAWEYVGDEVFRFQPPLTSYQELFYEGVPLTRKRPTANGGRPELATLEWCLYDRHIYFRPETDRLPQTYHLRHAGGPVGVTLYQVRHVVIRDLTVQGCQLDGINAHNGCIDVTLEGVTSRGNGRSGVAVCGSSKLTLDACLLGNNGEAQLWTEGWSTTLVVNSTLLANTAPAWRVRAGKLEIDGELRTGVGTEDVLAK